MRTAIFVLGLIGVVGGASAGDLDSPLYSSDATAGRLTFETRFGGDHFAFTQRSFQLQFGSERQLNTGLVPFRSEYRLDSGQFLVNGVDLTPAVANAEDDDSGFKKAGWWTSWGGWIPLAIVMTGVAFVVVDGRDNGIGIGGSGGS